MSLGIERILQTKKGASHRNLCSKTSDKPALEVHRTVTLVKTMRVTVRRTSKTRLGTAFATKVLVLRTFFDSRKMLKSHLLYW
jgi:hypothetical protein